VPSSIRVLIKGLCDYYQTAQAYSRDGEREVYHDPSLCTSKGPWSRGDWWFAAEFRNLKARTGVSAVGSRSIMASRRVTDDQTATMTGRRP
jgi:hypothetical protein